MLVPSIFGEDLFDSFFDGFGYPVSRKNSAKEAREAREFWNANAMRTDVKETDDGYELDIDLPGYKKEEVSAELKDGYMTIKAETSKDNDEENKKFIRRERFYGSCERSFYVGEDVTEEDIKAKFDNGTLKLFVPKKEHVEQVPEKKLIAIEG